MNTLIVEGGVPLSGTVSVIGNKNAVLPIIAASILTDEEIILQNVPNILDVRAMLEIVEALGIDVSQKNNTVKIKASKIKTSEISQKLCSKIRTSFLFSAPLINRCGKAKVYAPGGDAIGRRRLDAHFYGFQSLGVDIISNQTPFEFELNKELLGRDLFLDEASVTATEHIMMLAVCVKGTTIIRNSASEPHVKDLGEFLIKMGAKIEGLGTNTIIITGVDSLHGATHRITEDHIEAGSFIAMAAATGGELTIQGIQPGHYWMTRRVFEKLGVHIELRKNEIFVPGNQSLKIAKDIGNAIPTISDGPWPQFPSDMMSCTLVMATQAQGTVLFFEKMFESRMYFVDTLIRMGANAIVCDPHRVVITGPAKLKAIEMATPDIRAGMAMIIAAMCAEGKSIINNTNMVARGYENIVEKLSSIGGKVKIK